MDKYITHQVVKIAIQKWEQQRRYSLSDETVSVQRSKAVRGPAMQIFEARATEEEATGR